MRDGLLEVLSVRVGAASKLGRSSGKKVVVPRVMYVESAFHCQMIRPCTIILKVKRKTQLLKINLFDFHLERHQKQFAEFLFRQI
jgi:hypothetical protein